VQRHKLKLIVLESIFFEYNRHSERKNFRLKIT
jgi:hypothetical protein